MKPIASMRARRRGPRLLTEARFLNRKTAMRRSLRIPCLFALLPQATAIPSVSRYTCCNQTRNACARYRPRNRSNSRISRFGEKKCARGGQASDPNEGHNCRLHLMLNLLLCMSAIPSVSRNTCSNQTRNTRTCYWTRNSNVARISRLDEDDRT